MAKKFIDFNKKNYSPYNSVNNTSSILSKNSFIELNEKESWKLEKGNFYYLRRGYNSSIVAFHVPKNFDEKRSFKIIGTHTDSPSIRLAPKFDHKSSGY